MPANNQQERPLDRAFRELEESGLLDEILEEINMPRELSERQARQEREARRSRPVPQQVVRPSGTSALYGLNPFGTISASSLSGYYINDELEVDEEAYQQLKHDQKWQRFVQQHTDWNDTLSVYDPNEMTLGSTPLIKMESSEYRAFNREQQKELMERVDALIKELTMSRIRREGSSLSWVGVESSAIAAVAYEPRQEVLFVLFKKGQVYSYDNVSQYKYNKLLSAESKGEYLNKSIKSEPDKHSPNHIAG